ncbi:MAG: PTS sugar transporter subunit IIA [Planctomycetales bacterium]|nr:PTS sugar transporter subunit IIA [Planctomycetales bacterium]
MADEDFDVATLAAYLHVMPAQVSRMAERGNVPARRIGGDWRFSRPEINQWLEERIGATGDDQELADMEDTLRRVDQVTVELTLAELMPLDAVAAPLAARTRGKVIAGMCDLAATTGLLWDPAKMADAVTAREDMHSTALDIGVALLHPRRPQGSILGGPIVALGLVSGGIPFGGGGGGLTDVFFLIAATNDHEHLRALARLSRMINDPVWLSELRVAPDAATARKLVVSRDQQLGG